MRFVYLIFTCCIFFSSSYSSIAQVGEAKAKARAQKSSGSSSSSGSSDSGSSVGSDLASNFFFYVGWELIQLPVKGLYLGQADQLLKAKTEDWRISFEGKFMGAYDPLTNTTLIQPNIRGNWGLFSTQLRYNRIFDETGVLSTWDWQIIQFNFINNDAIKLVFGMGISHEIEVDQTHFEGSVSLTVFPDLYMEWAPTVAYRWSGDGGPRQEISAILDYRPNIQSNILNTFHAGYMYQSWYGEQFNFLVAGVGFRIQ